MQRFNKQSGFTLIEVAIVMPMTILLITGMITILYAMLGDFSDGKLKQTLSYQNQAALEQIESDVKLSSAFLTALDNPPMNTDSFNYATTKSTSASFSYKGSGEGSPAYKTLLLRKYSTTADSNNKTRRAISKNIINCTTDSYANDILSHNVVYFVSGGKLYRRIITDTTTPVCQTQYQKQSCPANASATDRSTSNCNTNIDDALILSGVTGFSVNYYKLPVDATSLDVYSSTDPAILKPASTVDVSITTAQKGAKSQSLIQVTSTIRASESN